MTILEKIKAFWHHQYKRQIFLAALFLAALYFLGWINDPNKSAKKIRKAVTERYTKSKADYTDIKIHCRDFMDTCGCGEYELAFYGRHYFMQRCNIIYPKNARHGSFKENQESIIKDFMEKQHISAIMLYQDSMLFYYSDLAHDNHHVRLNITGRPMPGVNRLDTDVYYYW